MALIVIDAIPALTSCSSYTITWTSTLGSLSNLTLSILDSSSILLPHTLIQNSSNSANSFTWNSIDVPEGLYIAELKAVGQSDINASSQVISSYATFTVETGAEAACLSKASSPEQLTPQVLAAEGSPTPTIPPISQTFTYIGVPTPSQDLRVPTYTYDLHKTTRITIAITVSAIMLVTGIYFLQRWFRQQLRDPQQTYLRRRDFLVAITRRMALKNVRKSHPEFFSIASTDTRSELPLSSRHLDLHSSMIVTTPGSWSRASTILESGNSLVSNSDVATRGYPRSSYHTAFGSMLASPTMLQSPSLARHPGPRINPISSIIATVTISRATSIVPVSGRSMASDVATRDRMSYDTAALGELESPALARCSSADSDSLRRVLFPMDDPFSDMHHV